MLPRAKRLTTRQFDRAFADSQVVRHPLVVLRAHFRSDGESLTRAAFVVPKKQAKKATARNLIRRRLRERYRLHPLRNSEILAGCDLIFLATPQTAGASVGELDAALEDVLKRATKRIQSDRRLKPTAGQPSANRAPHDAKAPRIEDAPMQVAENVSCEARLVEARFAAARFAAARFAAGFNLRQQQPFLPLTFLALSLIRFYQRFISPGLPPSCRFEPSCSRYTYAAIERFGLLRGTFLGAARICKCHPWHAGGDDPVPPIFPDLRSKSQNKKRFSMRFRSLKGE